MPLVYEVPIGKINGINKKYRLSAPSKTATLQIFLNGILLDNTMYTIKNNSEFKTEEAPITDDILQIAYLSV